MFFKTFCETVTGLSIHLYFYYENVNQKNRDIGPTFTAVS